MSTKKKKTAPAKAPKKKPATKVAKPAKAKVKKVVSIAKGIDITVKEDGTYQLSGKNAKGLEGIKVERKERQYKFDERLVPYYLGGDTKDGNLAIREALIKLGKTEEMTQLFSAMKVANFAYRDDAKERFIQALYTIVRGHDEVGLQHVHDEDIKAIHDNNLKIFDSFYEALSKSADEYAGFE